jgi:hypothetical protein
MPEQLSEQLGDDRRIHEYSGPNQKGVEHGSRMAIRGGPSFLKL